MGLDMYLNKMPRYEDVNAKQISMIETYFDWVKEKENNSDYANCSFNEWCNCDLKDLPSIEVIEFYRQFYNKKYCSWDKKCEYGHVRIMDEVAYWRKANAIHNWFVNNVQDGIDDCDYHKEVTKENLVDLLKTCLKVMYNCELVDHKITEGVSNKLVKDTSVADALLPTTAGFFFGGTEYDEWYIEDLKKTIDAVVNILATTDFEKEMLYYVSSW